MGEKGKSFICIKSDERGIQEEMTDPKLAEYQLKKSTQKT